MILYKTKEDCCGCSACANACPKQCITMVEDREGFLYPKIEEDNCISCGGCRKACPIINNREKQEKPQSAHLVQNKDRKVLEESTAGGAFTAVADYVIEQGGVVFGAVFTKEYEVIHTYVEQKEELYRFRNSKYVQSKIGLSYQKVKEFLRNGRLVVFSGTPCQIEGLRSFLKKDYENLILVDVVCRAVPSPGIFRQYLQLEKKENIESIRFRDKKRGYHYSTMMIKRKDGKVKRGGIESQLWLRMFFSGMVIRPSCESCRFKKQYRNSDMTIWDCFDVYRFDKEFDPTIGTTRVLIHSAKGKAVLDNCTDKINCKEIKVEEAVKGVHELVKPRPRHKDCEAFFDLVESEGLKMATDRYFKLTAKHRIKRAARRSLNAMGLDLYLKKLIKR